MRLTIAGLSVALAAAAAPNGPVVTFNRDVLPVLQKQCQECHRPGEVAPISFLSYQETRPWAKAIKAAVLTKKMPPWFADPSVGHFRNERKLSDAEIKTLVSWADNGALEGDAKDKPAPVQFASGWSIGKPDIIVEMPRDIHIDAQGQMDQANVLVKVNFPRDMWVKAAEVRPGNPKVVHHMKAWVRPPGSEMMKDAPEGELYRPQRGGAGRGVAAAAAGATPGARPMFGEGVSQDMLAKFNPGVNAQEFTIGDAAKFIPAGSDIVFECHYVPSGKPETDRSRVGIVLASAPPEKRYLTVTGINSNTSFVIPAGNPNYEVKAGITIANDVQLVWIQPHMHMRAINYELKAIYPSGESEVVLRTPRYDFNWQLGYELAKPLFLPKGTRLETVAHYDNSPNNPYNPNPNVDVRYGPQSTDEMAASFLGIIFDAKMDPATIFPRGRRPVSVIE
jgi:hypothetical protein